MTEKIANAIALHWKMRTAKFILPAAVLAVTLTGCGVETWEGTVTYWANKDFKAEFSKAVESREDPNSTVPAPPGAVWSEREKVDIFDPIVVVGTYFSRESCEKAVLAQYNRDLDSTTRKSKFRRYSSAGTRCTLIGYRGF